jgi:APA family basic amino acid/polyamine antiporter
MSDHSQSETPTAAPQRHLTLFDSTSIIVGIIIGAGIYESTPLIAQNVPGVYGLIGAWLLGGFLSFVGALCYAELATAYPRAGGDFVYLTRSFDRPIGFLFAWAQLWVVRPGSIGAMAFIFARYANHLVPLRIGQADSNGLLVYAAGSVLVLSLINLLGVKQGKWTQNILTTAKVLGLLLVAVVGLLFSAPRTAAAASAAAEPSSPNFGLAMIFVLFAFGGWNEMAYVGAEVRDPKKNILRALTLGTVAVAAIYILLTLAFLHALGLEGVRNSKAVAAEVLDLGLGGWGDRLISVLICISALGAINGQVFTGARIYYAMGKEHPLFAALGQWNARLGTPVWSLVVQGAITLAVILGFGWMGADKGFQRMVIFTTPVFWIFLVMVGQSLFVLRRHEPHTPRPYRVPLYPIPPILLCLSSLYMVFTSVDYALQPFNRSYEAFWSIGLLLAGVVMCFFDPKPASSEESAGPSA